MLQRYQTGEDLEELSKTTRELTEEEEKKRKDGSTVIVEGVKRTIEDVIGRKKLKQSYEYECSFKGLSSSENLWLPRDDLITRGFEKKIMEVDTREAQKAGLLRPLVRREIENHMADFGLEPEFVTHNTMRGLSGGQKVKVVLVSCLFFSISFSSEGRLLTFASFFVGLGCRYMATTSRHDSRRTYQLLGS